MTGHSPLRAATALALLIGGIAAAQPARAGSFQVNPVNLSLPADRQAASLTVRNSDATPVALRVVTYKWTQEEGRDVYSETNDVIASPPIFTIKPGATQLLRVGLRTRSPGPGAYRIILEEIPRQQPDGTQIQVTLRLNLPLYVLAPKAGKADLSWRAWRDGSGELFVEAQNKGTAHAQVLEIAADEAGTRQILSKQMGVILPASARHWKIGKQPGFRVGAPMLLKVRNSAGETQANILLEQR